MRTHALNRTGPKGKGKQFIGTCFQCGTKGLPAEAVKWACENPANLTSGEALLIAIADRNPTGGDVKQAPSRSDESGGAGTAIAQDQSETS